MVQVTTNKMLKVHIASILTHKNFNPMVTKTTHKRFTRHMFPVMFVRKLCGNRPLHHKNKTRNQQDTGNQKMYESTIRLSDYC